MTATTHPEFNADTESLDVAKAFPESIRRKNIIVTGVNRGGIGYATSLAFASQSSAHLIIAGRSTTKLAESIDALKAKCPHVDYRPLKLDLSSQKTVREAAVEVLGWNDIPAIGILVNSAGVMLVPERTLNADGIEMHFATNHIGHFLRQPHFAETRRGCPREPERHDSRGCPKLSSPTTAGIRWSDINFDRVNRILPEDEQPMYDSLKGWGIENFEEGSYFPREGYNQSKVANLLFAIGFNRKFYEKYGILSVALNPGVIRTELQRNFSPDTEDQLRKRAQAGALRYKTLGAGAATSLIAATDPALGLPLTKDGKENYGAYMADYQISVQANPRAVASANADRLWALSESWSTRSLPK